MSPRSPSFTKHGKQSAAELPRLVYVAAEWLINISLALGRRHIQARLRSPSVSPFPHLLLPVTVAQNSSVKLARVEKRSSWLLHLLRIYNSDTIYQKHHFFLLPETKMLQTEKSGE